MHRPCRVCVLFSLVLLSAFGCGLRDYEKHMDDRSKYVAFYDEENKYLAAGGISRPREKTKDSTKEYWPPALDVFLRVPKEISQSPESYKDKQREGASVYYQANPNSFDVRLFRYPAGRDYGIFVALAWIGKGVAEKGKAAKEQEWPVNVFREQVRGALQDYCRKELRFTPELPSFTKTHPYKVQPPVLNPDLPPPSPIDYEMIPFYVNLPAVKDDPTRTLQYYFQAYFYQYLEVSQVAVIVQLQKSAENDDEYRKQTDWCLKSLALDPGSIATKRKY
jgi:hypothetical protein